MNWHAIGAIGQILGSLATFVTVGYLVVQVHDSEREAHRSAVESRTERNVQMGMTLAGDVRLAGILTKANAALASAPKPPFLNAAERQLGLTEVQAYMLQSFELARWAALAQSINYIDDLPPEDRSQMERTLRVGAREPIFKFWYEFTKPTLNPKAVRFVDDLLAQPN